MPNRKAIIFTTEPIPEKSCTSFDVKEAQERLEDYCRANDFYLLTNFLIKATENTDSVIKLIQSIDSMQQNFVLVFDCSSIFRHDFETPEKLESALNLKYVELHFLYDGLKIPGDKI